VSVVFATARRIAWRTFTVAGVLALLAISAADAAAQNMTTGLIRGRIVNPEGQPISSASVMARNTETGLERSALSDADGQYILRLLPPGTYTVRAEVIGYRAVEQADIRVHVAQTTTTNLQMATQAVALAAITVTGEQPVSVTTAAVQTTINQEQIQQLPSLGRDFTDFIRLSGLVAPNPETTTGGQFSIAGMRPSQTNIQIDGVDANNAYFGENRGGSRIPFTFSLESIREFQVITNGYDVEFGSYSGGVVNVVTRGGTNNFSGSVYGNFRNSTLTSPDFEGVGPRDFETSQGAARISGPIIRDRAFYLVSVDAQRRREPQTPVSRDYYLGFTDSQGNPTPDVARADSLSRFWQILSSRYGVQDPEQNYAPYSTTNDAITLFGRVDYNFNANNRLSVRHNYSNYSNDNEAGTFTFGRNRGEHFQDWSHSFVAELQSVLSPSTFNVMRFQYATEDRPRQGLELRPGLQVNILGGTQIGYGGAGLAYYNRLDERKAQFINNLTHSRGAHTMKVGGNALFTRNVNSFTRSGSGVYAFNSLADFEAYRPARYTRVLAQDGTVPKADFGVLELGIYAQDEWQVTPRLTATAGVRYDVQRFLDPPGRVIDVERALGIETGIAPVDNNNVSPRLSLAYDVRGDAMSVVRAGAGYFYGRVPYVMGGNVNSSDVPVVELVCEGNILRGDPSAPPNVQLWSQLNPNGLENPFGCAGAGSGTFGLPEFAFWSRDFEYPETFKSNIGYEQVIGRTRASIDLLYSFSTKLYTVRNQNLREAQFTMEAEGGRRIYTPRSQFSPATQSTQHLRNADFSNVFVNYNDGRARSFAATMELNHRLTQTVNMSGSYTYTNAADNSSFTCCTAFAGWTSPRVAAFGPNEIGVIGDTDRAWGPSDFNREHTFIATLDARLPYGFRTSAFWRFQTGNPWGPEVSGDLNGDGALFNDRPFIFAPDDLPLSETGSAADATRERYAQILNNWSCIGDYVGQIIPRNTCRQPSFNRLDMRITREIPTLRGQRAELQADLFNVLNGVGQLFCDRREAMQERRYNEGWCGLGQYTTIRTTARNLLAPARYDAAADRVLYTVPTSFGQQRVAGTGLMLQFQAQLAVRYFF
jgi:outer membrane receptor for ferrienterochelin and colicin